MSLIKKSKKKKIVNLIIIICFLLVSGCFLVEKNYIGGLVTRVIGIGYLGAYRVLEK